MGGELLGPDRDCSRDRSPALQAGSAFMELAALEPATSWVGIQAVSGASLTHGLTHQPETFRKRSKCLSSEADARTRTGDPFITSYGPLSPLVTMSHLRSRAAPKLPDSQ
jgi:hypothetical protein